MDVVGRLCQQTNSYLHIHTNKSGKTFLITAFWEDPTFIND